MVGVCSHGRDLARPLAISGAVSAGRKVKVKELP